MLTADELFNIPASIIGSIQHNDFKEYFDVVLLPRLTHETFGADGPAATAVWWITLARADTFWLS